MRSVSPSTVTSDVTASNFRLSELGKFLDVRSEAESTKNPIAQAANIPYSEIADRLHELPSKEELILIADTGPNAEEAKSYLASGNRKAQLTKDIAFIQSSVTKPHRLWKPNDFLMAVLPEIKRGRALDLGCGSGRDSVALAGNGYEVVAADILPDALQRGADLAHMYLIGPPNEEPQIDWLQRDLEKDGPPVGTFDLIISFRYLHRPLLARVESLLNLGGSLVLETFTELHRKKHGKPSSDHHVLKIGELPTLAPGLEIKIADELWRGDSHTGRLWAIKR